MSTNKRDLKAFVRYDGSGRIVSGSLILRKNKPKVGKWREISSYECCNPTTTTTLPPRLLLYTIGESFSISMPSVTMYCDEVQVAYQYSTNVGPYTTVDSIVEVLNETSGTSAFGVYSNAGGGVIQLSVYASTVYDLCSSGVLQFTVQAD